MKKVLIVGAGTAGLIAAAEIARSGIEVTVHESDRAPGDHAIKASGLLSKEGLERIGIDYKPAMLNKISGAIIHAGAETMKIRAPSTKAYVLDRRKLAEILYADAKDAGVEIVMGARLDRETLLAEKDRIIIGADGAISTVGSAFGFPEIKEHVLTYKAEYKLERPIDPKFVELFFDDAAFRLFGWTIPYSKSVLEVGIGLSKRAKKNSKRAFKSFLQKHMVEKLEGAEELSEHASSIPIGPRRITVKGNVALVGDAAGQVKSTTGGGIIFGSLCARLLAKCVIENVKNGKPLQLYEKKWRSAYSIELSMHSMLHELYSGLGTSGIERYIRIAQSLGMDKFLSKYGDMDRPSLMLKRFFLRDLVG
jgi:digeranylgeranylglycerophospholipid reductase